MHRRALFCLTLLTIVGCQGDRPAPTGPVDPLLNEPQLAIVEGTNSTAANGSSGGGTLTIPTPSGSVGDFLLAQVTFEKGTEVNLIAPSGWTLVRRTNFKSDIGQASFYKVATATEPGSYTWTFRKGSSSLQVRATGGISRLSGVDLDHPDGPIVSSTGNSGDGSALSAPGLNVPDPGAGAASNALLVSLHSVKKRTTLTVPTGMGEMYFLQHPNQSGPSIRASESVPPPLFTGNKVSNAGAADKWVAQLILLRAAVTVDFTEETTVLYTVNGETKAGVTFPAEPGRDPVEVSFAECDDLPLDIPLAGDCVEVITEPPIVGPNQLANAATVFFCGDLGVPTPNDPNHHQFTVHRYDGTVIQALPHADDACGETHVGDAGGSLKGLFLAFVRGDWKRARQNVVGLLTPKPLYASAAVLDVGGGGFTFEFSFFQLALPVKMEINAGNNQSAFPGTTLPTNPQVLVTDLLDIPVAGAKVKFVGDGVAATTVLTGTNGLASVSWTIPNSGGNSLTASGRGIAGPDFNGPRTGCGGGEVILLVEGDNCVDPFQPTPFGDEDEGESGRVQLHTGSVVFTATGVQPEPVFAGGFDFSTAGELPSGDNRYSSMELAQGATAPAGWETAAFAAAANGFTVGTRAPFGSGSAACTGLSSNTPWAVGGNSGTNGQDILVRTKFSLSVATTVNIRVSVDNDLVDIYLNGAKLNLSTLVHDGCAQPGSDAQDFEFTAPGVAGTNILAIRARDRGGLSYLNVTAIPTPILATAGTEAGFGGAIRYKLTVTNRADYPVALFAASPDLPACGLNTSASRTWVDVLHVGDNSFLNGFCAFSNPSNLSGLWFQDSATEPASPVYIKLVDRRYVGAGSGLQYPSNNVTITPP